jgi:hypothetical protein
MPNWKFYEPADEKAKNTLMSVYSEKMIIDEYFPWWSQKMKSLGREERISHQNCIDDFVTIHWAMPTVEPPGVRLIKND